MRNLFKENHFLKKIASQKAPIGFFNYIKDTTIMDLAGETGLDFVIIDTEHAVTDRETVERQILAAQLNDLVPMVRMPDTIPWLMRNYMEMGAQGVLIPQVSNAGECKRAQEALRYPPEGKAGACRSIHSTGYDPVNWMKYLDWVKDVSLIPMIEGPEGVENIEEILEHLKPERDMVMFGKADYGQAVGAMNPDGSIRPEVVEAYLKVVAACRKRGIGFMACASTTPEGQRIEDIKKVIEEGCSAVVLNTDQMILAEGFRRVNNQCRDMEIKRDQDRTQA